MITATSSMMMTAQSDEDGLLLTGVDEQQVAAGSLERFKKIVSGELGKRKKKTKENSSGSFNPKKRKEQAEAERGGGPKKKKKKCKK